MFLRILIGAGVVGLGLILVLKTEWILDFFGYIDWAEKNVGGSRNFYKVLGSFVVIIGFIVITNLWVPLLENTLGAVFSPKR